MANSTMLEMMNKAGFALERHADHFKPEEEDEVWIECVSRQQWVIITADKRIEKDHIDCVLRNNARVILLTDNNSGWVRWTASIVSARESIYGIIDREQAPFVVRLSKSGKITKTRLRPELVSVQKKMQTARIVRAKRRQ